jgi:hypothetical protein
MDKPVCSIRENGSREWHLNGRYHRDDGPAIIYSDGAAVWYRNGEIHREGGPAVKNARGYKAWYLNGKLHREDGPAIEDPGNGAIDEKTWCIEGVDLDPKSQSQKEDPRFARLMKIKGLYEIMEE